MLRNTKSEMHSSIQEQVPFIEDYENKLKELNNISRQDFSLKSIYINEVFNRVLESEKMSKNQHTN